MQDDPYELVPNQKKDALEFLQSLYNDPSEPKTIRMKAAIEALPYERPRLAVTATVTGDDMATRLDRAHDQRIRAMKDGKLTEKEYALLQEVERLRSQPVELRPNKQIGKSR
jgi:hypothetical protein